MQSKGQDKHPKVVIQHYQRREARFFRMEIWIARGIFDDPSGKWGISHLLEHLLVAQIRSNMTLFEQTKVYGYTGPRRIRLKFSIPWEEVPDHLPLVLNSLIHCQWTELETEKRRVLHEIRWVSPSLRVEKIEDVERKLFHLENASCLGDPLKIVGLTSEDMEVFGGKSAIVLPFYWFQMDPKT